MLELLAPGGSPQAIRAAVNAGADAVYAAGTMFGARAYADNPDEETLLACMDYCHLHGVKLYLTVNTLMKEKELEGQLTAFLRPLYAHGLDAVLVQDLGALQLIRERFPDLPIHASTQMSIQSVAGARLAAKLGISRIVTARELSLEEISRIYEQTGIEIECFVHGALCYSYSGQCLFSSLIGGRSGNRGRCAQPCRKTYRLSDTRGNLLSLKDLSALELIPEMARAGVVSFKIEGRMKSPLYTAGVTAIYRKYIDLYNREGEQGFRVDPVDRRLLEALFQKRGYTKGYYHVKNSPKMMAMFPGGARTALESEEEALAGLRAVLQEEKKEKIKGEFILRADTPAILKVRCGDDACTEQRVEGQIPQMARSRAVTREEIKKQLSRTGDTPFVFDTLEVQAQEDLFVPMGMLNQMRREALDKLRTAILAGFLRGATDVTAGERAQKEQGTREMQKLQEPQEKLRILVSSPAQLEAYLAHPLRSRFDRVYLDSLSYLDAYMTAETGGKREPGQGRQGGGTPERAAQVRDRIKEDVRRVRQTGAECFLALPWTWREDVQERFGRLFDPECFDGLLLRCLDQLGSFAGRGEAQLPLVCDANIYAWNHRAAQALHALGTDACTLPAELNLQELRSLMESLPEGERCAAEMSLYGYQNSMLTAQCLRKNTAGCARIPSVMYLQDERRARFPVLNHCGACMNVIYNAPALQVADQKGQLLGMGVRAFRLNFTVESGAQTNRVLDEFFAGKREGEYTRGHLRRGVE